MREKKSLEAILDSFKSADMAAEAEAKQFKTTITLWVPIELKERYDKIQQRSRRRFSARLREIVQTAIEIAEQKVG